MKWLHKGSSPVFEEGMQKTMRNFGLGGGLIGQLLNKIQILSFKLDNLPLCQYSKHKIISKFLDIGLHYNLKH
jgi:hypothetical protein